MSSIKQIENILDKKLYNNDINIIGIIMSYVIEECDICKDKSLDWLDSLEYGDIQDSCDECNDSDAPNNVCDDCHEFHSCYSCGEFLCECCSYDIISCDNDNCDRRFCEDCASKELLECEDCEEKYCCKGVYRLILTDGNCGYKCMDCIHDCYVRPTFSKP